MTSLAGPSSPAVTRQSERVPRCDR